LNRIRLVINEPETSVIDVIAVYNSDDKDNDEVDWRDKEGPVGKRQSNYLALC
jgi:hypothetical protein